MTDSWLLWAVLSAVFAALTAVLSKVGVRGVDPDAALIVRTMVVIALLTTAWPLAHEKSPLAAFTRQTWLYLLLAGAATTASWACYFRALKLGEVARVAAIDKLSVVLVAVISSAFLSERLSVTGWAGVALVGIGAALLSFGR